ncbi:hypothetical protein C8Q75DRAFT_807930 [Abortiporus biennis]|nr:hypothetical protein C8Q75DRAFT_807930 [Abortiporus biennis]
MRSSFIDQSSFVLRKSVVFVLIASVVQQTFQVGMAGSSLFALGAPHISSWERGISDDPFNLEGYNPLDPLPTVRKRSPQGAFDTVAAGLANGLNQISTDINNGEASQPL